MNKKAQLGISNVMFWIILVVVSVILTPIARSFINDAIAGTNNSLEILVLNGILPIYWILLIIVLINYATPQRPQY